MANRSLGVIGLGNMGWAVLNGLVSGGTLKKDSIQGFDLDRVKCLVAKRRFGIPIKRSIKELLSACDIILIAVKPKDMDTVLDEIASPESDKLYISVAAGIKTCRIEGRLGPRARVVRVMPNTPALVKEGMSAICKGRFAARKDLNVTSEIFSSVGDVLEINEKYFDAVTAISGSGPAYFFYLIEGLIKAAEESGLNRETAKRLVSKTALGSARLLAESKEEPRLLRQRVTSKGGTTEAAIKIFEKRILKKIIAQAVRAAVKRSKELSRS